MLKNSSYTFLMVTLTTVLLYVWGVAHLNGLIIVFGLNYAVLEQSFHQTLYYGFLYSFGSLIYYSVFTVLSFTVMYFFSYFIQDVVRGLDKNGNKKERPESKPDSNYVVFFKRNIILSLCFFVPFLLILFSLYYMEQDGMRLGNEKLANILSGNLDKETLINVKLDGESKELVLIVCGSMNCAGMELKPKPKPKPKTIYYFPVGSGFSFKYKPFKVAE